MIEERLDAVAAKRRGGLRMQLGAVAARRRGGLWMRLDAVKGWGLIRLPTARYALLATFSV